MMKLVKLLPAFFLVLNVSSCESAQSNESVESKETPKEVVSTIANDSANSNQPHKVTVKEVIQVQKYTYLFVEESGVTNWLAVPTVDAKVGDVLYYQNGMEMTAFESKELKRTFDRILFIDKISRDPNIATMSKEVIAMHQNMPAQTSEPGVQPTSNPQGMGSSKDSIKQNIRVEAAQNGITIAEILKSPKQFEGKKVVVRGKVTKYTPDVMGKNWVHIQDGTSYNGKFEIVVTMANPTQNGATITVEGPISLNKDLGYGYFFETLIEDGVIKP